MADEADKLLERVSDYVQAYGEGEAKELAHALAEARTLVTSHCGTQVQRVPADVLDRAIVETAAELFHRKSARNGVMDLGDTDLAPFRVRNDPLKAVYPLLTPYIGLGIG